MRVRSCRSRSISRSALLVVVGGLGQEGDDFGLVEAAQRGAEALLAQVERRDAHHARRPAPSRWTSSAARRTGCVRRVM